MPEAASAISWEKEKDVTIIRLNLQAIRDPDCSKQASDELNELAERFGGKMLLSLADVTDLSSVGIALLLTLNTRLRSLNGRLKICDIQPLVSGILTSSGLDKALELHASKAEAMAAFDLPPQGK